MKLSFQRGPELTREQRRLPAALYRQLRHALHLRSEPSVFVPIRSMQYLAVIDEEEVIFVDGMGDRRIELAWQHFRPQLSRRIDDPIPYECVFYDPRGRDTMLRLVPELGAALALLDRRDRGSSPGAVIARLPSSAGEKTGRD